MMGMWRPVSLEFASFTWLSGTRFPSKWLASVRSSRRSRLVPHLQERFLTLVRFFRASFFAYTVFAKRG